VASESFDSAGYGCAVERVRCSHGDTGTWASGGAERRAQPIASRLAGSLGTRATSTQAIASRVAWGPRVASACPRIASRSGGSPGTSRRAAFGS
jgi:hypothetical protein